MLPWPLLRNDHAKLPYKSLCINIGMLEDNDNGNNDNQNYRRRRHLHHHHNKTSSSSNNSSNDDDDDDDDDDKQKKPLACHDWFVDGEVDEGRSALES